ncbi:hypothetical protein ACF0H5_005576 [Mactra antiquata]
MILWMFIFVYIYNISQCDSTIFRGCDDPYFSGRNIALGQGTEQLGVYDGQDSSRAVDGNTDTSAQYGTCAHTGLVDTNSSPFWEVYFDDSYTITGIIIYSRSNKENRFRLKNFKVIAWHDEIDTLIYDDSIGQQYNDRIIMIKIDQFRDIAFMGVRIEIPPNTNLNVDEGYAILTLCEVEIYSSYEIGTMDVSTTTPTTTTTDINITEAVNVTKTLTNDKHVCVVVGLISGVGGGVIATVICVTIWYTKLRETPKQKKKTNTRDIPLSPNPPVSVYNDLRSDSRCIPMYEQLKTEQTINPPPPQPVVAAAASTTTTDDEYNYIHPQSDGYEQMV